MTNKRKPREFWISNPNKYDNGVYTVNKHFEDAIKVIEYSAYEELKESNRHFEWMHKTDNVMSGIKSEKIQELQEKLNVAVEAIEDYIKDDEKDLARDPDYFRLNRYAENRYWIMKRALKQIRGEK